MVLEEAAPFNTGTKWSAVVFADALHLFTQRSQLHQTTV